MAKTYYQQLDEIMDVICEPHGNIISEVYDAVKVLKKHLNKEDAPKVIRNKDTETKAMEYFSQQFHLKQVDRINRSTSKPLVNRKETE